MSKGGFDYSGMEELLEQIQGLQKGHEKFIRDFLTEVGLRVLAETKRRTPPGTGVLRNNWKISDVYRKGDELYIVLFNTKEYASYVENGHWQRNRFVPGSFFGGKFEYIPGYPFGMVLKNKWIEGYFMAKISIDKISAEIPARYNRAMQRFISGLEG